MAIDPQLSALLLRWRELQAQGFKPNVAEVCQDCPELVDAFQQLLSAPTEISHHAETRSSMAGQSATGEPALAPAQAADELGRLGEFRLLRVVGRGGMGIVYEGEDVHLKRRVAVKVLLPGLADEKYRQRFIREARAVASIKHEHVVTVYQVGREGDTPFMVMEFLEGESLEDRLSRQPIIPLAESMRIAREVVEGLAAAHVNNLVHRDVKPGNIWLGQKQGGVKLLDFGLVRPQTEINPLTAQGAIAGTIGYMAPEQIYAGPLDARTDLYAVGCVLYRMLCGSLPHEATDTMLVLDKVVNHEPVNLDAVARNLPMPVADLLRRLLARNPDERPASAEAVAAELTHIEAGLNGPAKTAPSAVAVVKPKHPLLGVWIGAVTVILACIIGLATQYHRIFHRSGPNPTANVPSEATAGANAFAGEPIRVGVLHSLSGALKDSERPMYEAIYMAVDEINSQGGVLGRKVELVVRDTRSDDDEYARLAEELIEKEKVSVLFGGWSSASRKMVAEICAKHNQLLIYSCIGEGLETNPHVVYVGGAPNQQLREAANWALILLRKKKVFLVGSEYDLYSYSAHEILKEEFKDLGVEVVGSELVSPVAPDFRGVVAKIKESKADVIFNTVDGTDNVAFFRVLRAAGISSKQIPTVWLGVGEDELGVLDLREMIGDAMVNPYFQSIPSAANAAFVERFQARFPARTRISDATEATYCAVYLWKQTVEKANTTEALSVREAFRGQSFEGPEGRIMIDKDNLYAWRQPQFGQISKNLVFEVIRGTGKLEEPKPFPSSRTRAEWEAFVNGLYKKWGNRWNGPREAPNAKENAK